MNFTSLALFAAVASAHANPITPPDVSAWTAGKAAIHNTVKDQGDLGFCWANSWTSYLESKVLIEQHKVIDLSAMYVGRAYVARGFIDTLETMNHSALKATPGIAGEGLDLLSRFQELKKNPFELEATRQFLIRKFQDHQRDDLEAYTFTTAYRLGVVPTAIYEKPDHLNSHLGPVAGNIPPFENRYQSPRRRDQFSSFIANHVMNDADMERYLAKDGIVQIEQDLDRELGNTPISEFHSFMFEGKEYNPRTFLSQYIHFDPTDFAMKRIEFKSLFDLMEQKAGRPHTIDKAGMVTEYDFDESIDAIQKELDQRRPVLLGMMVLDDFDSNDDLTRIGMMDPAYCAVPGKCKDIGGHAVMIVNSMKDASGKVKAFIIQNSWGPDGVTENGKQSLVRADRGFHIVTIDYLRAALQFRAYAFKYMMI